MKRASQFRPYRDPREFQAPPGIVTEQVCDDCAVARTEVFIEGTQPVVTARHDAEEHSSDRVVEEVPPTAADHTSTTIPAQVVPPAPLPALPPVAPKVPFPMLIDPTRKQ
jgi:hypothetical protein